MQECARHSLGINDSRRRQTWIIGQQTFEYFDGAILDS
jgi:hypothetical protein